MRLYLPLADHPLLETFPFFAPVLVIVAVLIVITIRDRRRRDDDEDGGDRAKGA